MAKSFDFNKIKPKTMLVTLSDEAKTTLTILTPDKRLRDDLVGLYDNTNGADDDEVNEALYELTARIMSRNKHEIEITSDQLKELYPDLSYIIAFINAYIEFINEATNSKN